MKTIIHNAEIINEGKQFLGYVIIDNDIISKVGEGTPLQANIDECNDIIDAQGMLLLPGAIDDQVHFREPGLTHKADIASESQAAVAGGVTSFMDMPNTKPATTTVELLEQKYDIAAQVSCANYSFYAGATNDNMAELRQVDFSRVCGVKVFMGSSTGNMLVDNKDTLRSIFSEIPSIVAIHSEDEAIINRNKAYYSKRFGNDLPVYFHPLIRSAEACYVSTARAVELANECGTRLHVLHISSAREMELLDNKPLSEKKITAEVCVHHLWFTDNDYAQKGNRIKCNPAVKTHADREALRNALKNGLIDVVATDHAPHLLSEKQGGCLTAASGMPLVQYSLVAMLEMARKGIFTYEIVIDKMCHAPATLYRINKRGFIREGYYADLVLVNQNASYTVEAKDIKSKCAWSPFEGERLHHKVQTTFVNGNKVYDNGIINTDIRGERLSFTI
ncbi:MAG: dihydroorotase [Bacteroidales bacterium]|nr:dihydroorotase [Bacteroidales bacterium]